MTALENRLYDLSDTALDLGNAVSEKAEELHYDPAGATEEQIGKMEEIIKLLEKAADLLETV